MASASVKPLLAKAFDVKEGNGVSLAFAKRFPECQDVLEQRLLEEIQGANVDEYVGTSCVITARALREVCLPGSDAKWVHVRSLPLNPPTVFQVEFFLTGESNLDCQPEHILTVYRAPGFKRVQIMQSFWKRYPLRIREMEATNLDFTMNPQKLWNLLVCDPAFDKDCCDSFAFWIPPS